MDRPSLRRRVLALLAMGAASTAAAQPASARPLHLIVPAPAGGTTETVARALAAALHRTAATTVLVDNRPGVGGAVATDAFLSAPRDGSTLLLSPNSLVTELPYTIKPRSDPFRDLVPLAEVASVGLVLVVNPDLPVATVPEMVAYVRRRPGKLAFASYGSGTLSHVKALHLCSVAGLDMLHVGYKGSPPALVDVLSGRVPFMFDGLTTSAPFVRSGRLRALAVTSPRRSALLHDVPTIAEAGFPELAQTIAMTLFTTPDVPAAAAAKTRHRVLEALDTHGLQAIYSAAGLQAGAPQQTIVGLRRAMLQEYERTGDLLRRIHYQPVS